MKHYLLLVNILSSLSYYLIFLYLSFLLLYSLLQLPRPSLFYLRNTVRLWLLIRVPALVGHPRPLLSSTPGTGQWHSDSRCQPLLHGPPSSPQQGGGTSGPQQDLPDPQPLHAGPGAAGAGVQTFNACWRRHGTPGHGSCLG